MDEHEDIRSVIPGTSWSEAMLADIVREIDVPVSVISRDFRILWANRVVVNAVGQSLAAIKGALCFETILDKPRRCPDCPVHEMFSREAPHVMERVFTGPDGSFVWREVRAYPVRDAGGRIVSAFRIGFDITAKKLRGARQSRYIETLEKALRKSDPYEAGQAVQSDRPYTSNGLTTRELDVLRLLAKGLANTEIAGVLCISPHTVKSHVTHIFNKLGVHDRTEAAVAAVRLKIV